ncbi:hypothetical protein [Nocardioides sp.]|jgi:hypothetical protein|uniref:hypothetical protein n=1 Tax=Nocardioides sp. TaxID=35761 RepID=UPI002F3E7DE9
MRHKQRDSQLASARVRTDEPAVSRVETITALAVVAIVALALVAIAWSMPTSRSDEKSVPYRQSGTFGYHAAADSAGTVYGDEGVRTGDPILVPLVGPVTATFDYRLDAAGAKRVHGTSQMVATVQTAGGLSRDFPVATSARFSGSRTTITGQLPLRAILAFVGQAQHDAGATDTSPSTLTLTPQVTVHGTAHGQRFGDHFGPQLTFDVDGSNLRVAPPDGATDVQSELAPTATGKATYRVVVTNRMPVLPLPVSVVRTAGLGVAVLCALMALWLAKPLLRTSGPRGEVTRIRALYGSRIVEVGTLSLRDGPIADVAGMDALAEIAKRYESMILHVSAPEAYLVWDNGMLYRYRPVTTLHPVSEHVAREA